MPILSPQSPLAPSYDAPAPSIGAAYAALDYGAYASRYETMRATYAGLAAHLVEKRILDFGCGKGMSACVLAELGASHVTGVDIFPDMMARGSEAVAQLGYADRVTLQWVRDTRDLPFRVRSFDAVVCNAVFEHIPQPRDAYVRSAWGMVAPGGVLIINETPNKYLPVDFHTLHLPFTNWLPSSVAHRVGVLTGRFRASRTDWDYSGWRGAGHYELLRAIPKHERRVVPILENARHRVFHALGLPAGLVDPYPLFVVERVI